MGEVGEFTGKRPGLWMGLLFSGDRWYCCNEGVAMKDEQGEILGIATISFKGEDQSGQPGIVGLYTIPEARNGKLGINVGFEVFKATVERCINDHGFTNIRVDVLSPYALKIVGKLDDDLKQHLDIHDMSASMGPMADQP